MKKLIFILTFIASLALFGCKGEPGPAGVPGKDADQVTVETFAASGYAHKGLPEYGGLARAAGTDPTNDLQQTGNNYLDYIANHEGLYDFGSIPDQYYYLFIQAHFHDEIRNTISDVMNLHGYIRGSDLGEKHANVLTTIETPIFEKLVKVDYAAQPMPDKWNNARAEAKTRVLNFFNMPSAPGEELQDGDISGDTKMDQINQAVSVIILNARSTTSQQASLMASVGDSLALSASGDLALKNELLTLAKDIDLVQTNSNIESKFASIGLPDKKANRYYNHLDHDFDGIRNDDDPDSYVDIIVEAHEIKGHTRISDSCNLSFDTADQRFFANPVVFDSTISTSNYFTANFDSEYMSIYSVDDHGTIDTSDDTPNAPLDIFLDATGDAVDYVRRIPADFFTGQYQDASDDTHSVPQSFSASIKNHTIPVGTSVYVVFWSDLGYQPSGLCQSGELVDFSRNQYSADGVSWLGAAPQTLNPVYGRYKLLKGAWLD